MQQAVSRKSGQALGTLRFEEKSMGGRIPLLVRFAMQWGERWKQLG